ncbi:MAG: 7TM domain-containing protein [Candidatus Peregrinibacteria bacterium]|nr:7TM domain-containing protein [Candidatus Peregrinibacteria bacterium]
MRSPFLTLGVVLCCLLPAVVAAQDAEVPISGSGSEDLSAIITGPEDIAVGRTIILDGSSSRVPGPEAEYRWFIGDARQPISRTVEAVYTPEQPGDVTFRLVVTARVGETLRSVETSYTVTAYLRKIVLIADATVPADKLESHVQTAKVRGIRLRTLHAEPAAIPLGEEEALTTLLSEEKDAFLGAESIILWTEGISGLQALMRALEGDTERLSAIHNQTIILITDRSLQTLARTARGPFSVLEPARILITRKEAITPLTNTDSIDAFLAEVEQRDIDALVLDASTVGLRPWNVLSSLVNFMLTHGVSSQSVILLLVLPVIATILAFLKQVVGITTFGLFAPSIVALSFLALGWAIGVLFLLFIIATGYATRTFMRRWRLLYIPKVAIILTVVSITLLLLLGIGAYFGITFTRDTVFVLLVMSTLAESFLNLKAEEGWLSAVIAIGETILASLLCVAIVQWPLFQSFLLAYPEAILTTILVNIILGRWTGLRLVEYFRFREVFKHLQEE